MIIKRLLILIISVVTTIFLIMFAFVVSARIIEVYKIHYLNFSSVGSVADISKIELTTFESSSENCVTITDSEAISSIIDRLSEVPLSYVGDCDELLPNTVAEIIVYGKANRQPLTIRFNDSNQVQCDSTMVVYTPRHGETTFLKQLKQTEFDYLSQKGGGVQ